MTKIIHSCHTMSNIHEKKKRGTKNVKALPSIRYPFAVISITRQHGSHEYSYQIMNIYVRLMNIHVRLMNIQVRLMNIHARLMNIHVIGFLSEKKGDLHTI